MQIDIFQVAAEVELIHPVRQVAEDMAEVEQFSHPHQLTQAEAAEAALQAADVVHQVLEDLV